MGVTEMRDVVAHHICSSDPSFDVHSLGDVKKVLRGLGFAKTERFETSEGSWLRFSSEGASINCLNVRNKPPARAGPYKTPSEYAYDLKLPIHLHVAPQPEVHFRPFIEAVKFFTGKLAFHLKKIE